MIKRDRKITCDKLDDLVNPFTRHKTTKLNKFCTKRNKRFQPRNNKKKHTYNKLLIFVSTYADVHFQAITGEELIN